MSWVSLLSVTEAVDFKKSSPNPISRC